MGVANTKSTLVTNADAAVQTLNKAGLSDDRLYSAVATVEYAAADDDGSVYRMFRVYSSWRVLRLHTWCDAITSSSVNDVGLYQTAANGGAVLSQNCYANDQTFATALTALPVDLANHSRDVALLGQQVWADGGLTADSNRWYDLCITASTVGSAAGTVTMQMSFTKA